MCSGTGCYRKNPHRKVLLCTNAVLMPMVMETAYVIQRQSRRYMIQPPILLMNVFGLRIPRISCVKFIYLTQTYKNWAQMIRGRGELDIETWEHWKPFEFEGRTFISPNSLHTYLIIIPVDPINTK